MLAEKMALASLWSMNGLMEKYLLIDRSPASYATTKALCVAFGYLTTQPDGVDMSLLRDPRAWVLILVSLFNTPLYARIAKYENPAISLPIVAAASQILRIFWMYLLGGGGDVLNFSKVTGVLLVIAGGFLMQR